MERTGRKAVQVPPAKPRLVLYDQSGELSVLLARYAEDIDVYTSGELDQAIREVRAPAYAGFVINAASPMDLLPLVERARLAACSVPIIGCSLPPKDERALTAGACSYMLKPVTRVNLESALQAVHAPVRTVLVVDDEPDALQMLCRMLRACDESVQVETAESGHLALQKMHDVRPDVVLLDVILPDIDGWQVLALKNSDEQIRDIPVVLLSARDPRHKPVETPVLVAAMGEGLSIGKLLTCIKALSALLPQAT